MTSQPGDQSQHENVSMWSAVTIWLHAHRAMLLLAMGLLDAMAIGQWWKLIRFTGGSGYGPDVVTIHVSYDILLLVLVVTLCFTAYGLSVGRRWAMLLYFFQLPFRIACGVFTFGFLYDMAIASSVPWIIVQITGYGLVVLELVRLVITIMYYRKARVSGNAA